MLFGSPGLVCGLIKTERRIVDEKNQYESIIIVPCNFDDFFCNAYGKGRGRGCRNIK